MPDIRAIVIFAFGMIVGISLGPIVLEGFSMALYRLVHGPAPRPDYWEHCSGCKIAIHTNDPKEPCP